jgi:hypothetical protein
MDGMNIRKKKTLKTRTPMLHNKELKDKAYRVMSGNKIVPSVG